jgi:hypothetical protein
MRGRARVTRSGTAPYLCSAALHSIAQSQYLFVLPWVVVTRGGSPASAVLSAATAHLPYLFLSPFAGLAGDRVRPSRLLAAALALSAAAAAAYPLAAAFGEARFAVVYGSAVAFGVCRPFVDAALFRAIAAPSPAEAMRLQARRSVILQVGGLGGPALGLGLFHVGGIDAVCAGVFGLLAAGALVAAAARVRPHVEAHVPARSSLGFLRRSAELRRLAVGICAWNLVAGAAFSVVAPLLERAGVSVGEAVAVFAAGAVGIASLTLPVVRRASKLVSPAAIFSAAIVAEGAAFAAFSQAVGAVVFVSYTCFVVANSVASSASSGARAAAVRPQEQSFLNVVSTAGAAAGYVAGVLIAGGVAHALHLRPAALVFAAALVLLGVAYHSSCRPRPAGRTA